MNPPEFGSIFAILGLKMALSSPFLTTSKDCCALRTCLSVCEGLLGEILCLPCEKFLLALHPGKEIAP